MFIYAHLNEQDICVGIHCLAGEVSRSDYILINGYDISLLGKKFTGGQWVAPEAQEAVV